LTTVSPPPDAKRSNVARQLQQCATGREAVGRAGVAKIVPAAPVPGSCRAPENASPGASPHEAKSKNPTILLEVEPSPPDSAIFPGRQFSVLLSISIGWRRFP